MEIIKKLSAYCPSAVGMHMPGHKRNTKLSGENGYLQVLRADLDITEIDGFDNLHMPDGIIKESQDIASELWDCAETYYSVNGSTSCILSAVYACTLENKRILVGRNCHKSVYNSLRIFDSDPVFIMPQTDFQTGACGAVDPDTVRSALENDPGIKTVIITSPTYEGIISDIRKIADIVHSYDAVLIVDEAHGAHFGLYGVFPENAVSCGADIVIHSLHKTLPSLTSTACAHVSRHFAGTAQADEFRRALTVFSTSSPSYLLISSIDSCVRLMQHSGEKILSDWMNNLEWFYSKVRNLKNLTVADPFVSGDRDPSKIIICTADGISLADILRHRYSIEPEMAAPGYVIAMTGAGDTRENLSALADALIQIDSSQCSAENNYHPVFPSVPVFGLKVKDAYVRETEVTDIYDADEKISAEYIWSYPPGIPVIVPGEVFSTEISDYLLSVHVSGTALYSDRRGEIKTGCLTVLTVKT